MRVLITPTSLKETTKLPAMTRLKDEASELIFNPYQRPMTEEELILHLTGCDGLIAGLDPITAKVLGATSSLKVISRYGAGVDRVDIEAATQKGIKVTNTPGVNAQAVAELTLALMFSVARSVPLADRQVKSGKWPRHNGIELKGKILGLIGLGAIGRAVAAMARGINMSVIAYDPALDIEWCKEHHISVVSLEELFEQADVISLHVPHNEATHHLVNSKAIAKMKESAILINTSRGGLIDDDAIYEALLHNHIRGLALDAYGKEPPEITPLLLLDNVITTPHTGAHTDEAREGMATLAINNCLDVLNNKSCAYVLNEYIV